MTNPASPTSHPSSTGRQRAEIATLVAKIQSSAFVAKYGTVVAAVLVFVVFSIASNRFLSFDNLSIVLVQISVLMVVSSGLTVAVASGEFDLSIGQVTSLAGVLVAGLLVWARLPVALAILLTILSGIAIGFVNGVLITRLRVPSMIATLAMGPIALGLNYAYTNGDSIYALMPDSFYYISKGMILGFIPAPIAIAIIVAIVFYVMLNKTRLGRGIVATGANIQAARLSGIKVDRSRIVAMVLSGTRRRDGRHHADGPPRQRPIRRRRRLSDGQHDRGLPWHDGVQAGARHHTGDGGRRRHHWHA